MPYLTLLLLTILIYSHATFAQDEPRLKPEHTPEADDQKSLITNDGDKAGDTYSDDQTPAFLREEIQSNGDELIDECNKLKREYDSLKGKPQRRWALKERYKAQCQAYFDLRR